VGHNSVPAVRSSVDHSFVAHKSVSDHSSVGQNFGVGRKSAGHKASGKYSVASTSVGQHFGVNR